MKKFFFIIKLHFRNFESCGKQKLRTSIKLIWFSSPFIKRPRKISTKLFLSLSITFRNYSWEDWKMHYVEWEVTDSIKLPSLSRTVHCQFVIINFFTFLFAHLSISRISLVKQLIIRYSLHNEHAFVQLNLQFKNEMKLILAANQKCTSLWVLQGFMMQFNVNSSSEGNFFKKILETF